MTIDSSTCPGEGDLFAACSAHYFAANPWPDLATWRAIRDPHERLELALDELYAYYERTGAMLGNVLRDAELVESARDAVAPLHAYLEETAAVLTTGRRARGRRRRLFEGALRHALAFSTWRSLSVNGVGRGRHRAVAGLVAVNGIASAEACPRMLGRSTSSTTV